VGESPLFFWPAYREGIISGCKTGEPHATQTFREEWLHASPREHDSDNA
jgi:hypothetical protein